MKTALVIRVGRKQWGIDLALLVSEAFKVSLSQAKRLIKQHGVEVYLKQEVDTR